MSFIYPRLDDGPAVGLITEYSRLDRAHLTRLASTSHRAARFGASGSRATTGRLEDVRAAIVEVARAQGWPNAGGGRSESSTRFDQQACGVLFKTMDIVPADASEDGVWSFLSLVLLPDVSLWRFPNLGQRGEYDRLLGRPRNVFRRLWWRALVLGDEPGGPNTRLLEDEAVNIMERPVLTWNPLIGRTMAEAHLDAVSTMAVVRRTELMRQTAKRMRRLSTPLTLGAISPDSLRQLVDSVVADALLELDKPKSSQAAAPMGTASAAAHGRSVRRPGWWPRRGSASPPVMEDDQSSGHSPAA